MKKVYDQHVGDCDGHSNSPGAIFFGVCRAKFSEGIDFKDKQARLVIIVGLPIPNMKAPYVVLKSELHREDGDYLDKMAMRAVNQAIGRVIRHVKDYGAIVLIEQRYANEKYTKLISNWLRCKLQPGKMLPQICGEIQQLIEINAQKFPLK